MESKKYHVFIQQLQHLITCRNSLNNKFKEINEAERLEFIPLKNIDVSDSDITSELQQRTDGSIVKSMDCLYNAAIEISPKFSETIDSMVQKAGKVIHPSLPFCPKPQVILSDLKDRQRADIKSRKHYGAIISEPRYSKIHDIVRCNIVCYTSLQIASCVTWLGNHCEIVRAKNRFAEPCFNAYRDILLHVKIQDEVGAFSHICEVQISHWSIFELGQSLDSYSAYINFCDSFSALKTSSSVDDHVNDLKRIFFTSNETINHGFLDEIVSMCDDVSRLWCLAKIFGTKLKDYDMALGLLQGTLSNIKAPADHIETLERNADLYLLQGDEKKAMIQYSRILEVQKKSLGYDHYQVALTLDKKAGIFMNQYNLDAASKMYLRSLMIKRKTMGDDHPDTAETLLKIAGIQSAQGETQQALKKGESALKVFKTYLSKDHCLVADSMVIIAYGKHRNDEIEEALETYEKALQIIRNAFGDGHVRIADVAYKMALAEHDLGHDIASLRLFENALMIYKKVLRIDNPKLQLVERHIQRMRYSRISYGWAGHSEFVKILVHTHKSKNAGCQQPENYDYEEDVLESPEGLDSLTLENREAPVASTSLWMANIDRADKGLRII
jgi:tetratricopeptide (TPR) repeat protein